MSNETVDVLARVLAEYYLRGSMETRDGIVNKCLPDEKRASRGAFSQAQRKDFYSGFMEEAKEILIHRFGVDLSVTTPEADRDPGTV